MNNQPPAGFHPRQNIFPNLNFVVDEREKLDDYAHVSQPQQKMTTTTQCLKIAAKGITTRRHLRLVRGTFDRLTANLSTDLRDSAIRTFDRIAKEHGKFSKY
jgi:hypothetical protein